MNAIAHGVVIGVQVMRNDAVHLEPLMKLEGQHRILLFLAPNRFDVLFDTGELLEALAQTRQSPGEDHTLQPQRLA